MDTHQPHVGYQRSIAGRIANGAGMAVLLKLIV